MTLGVARAVGAAATGSMACLSLSFACLALAGIHLRPSAASAADPSPAPTLVPGVVDRAGEAFSLVPPQGARCEEVAGGAALARTGADGWRWHSFIVEEGRDPGSLTFGPFGPGDDYDATDGSITAGLLVGGEGVWQRLPALEPEGQLNPNELAGLSLDPAVYTLVDGAYQVGFACTDQADRTRQWWALTVRISTGGEPFLSMAEPASRAGDAPRPPERARPERPADVPGEGPRSAVASSPAGPGAADGAMAASTALAAPTLADRPVGSEVRREPAAPLEPSGVSWLALEAPLGASLALPPATWLVLALLLARAAYLLASPVPVVPLPVP